MNTLHNNTRDKGSGMPRDRLCDYAPVKQGLPVREESVTPLRPGPFIADATVASVDDVGLLRARIGIAAVGVTILDPTCIGFAIPVSWAGEYVLNGETVNASALYTPGDLDSVHVHGGSRDTLGVILPRDRFIETVAALRGVGPEDVTLKARALQLTPAAGAKVRQRIAILLEEASKPDLSRTPQAIANEVFGVMTDAYLLARPESAANPCSVQRPDRIVRMAEERFMAALGTPVSLADLCAAAGVSKSTLYLAFHNICGESPLQYFHKRRLVRARSALLNAAPERGVIKRTALDVGLTELGRFSVQYRNLFGELPSTTLNKAPY